MVRRLPTALLIVIALSAAATPAAHARVARGFVGLVNDQLIDASPKREAKDLRTQARVHAGTLRQTFDWARIERSRGEYAFREYDRVVAAAAMRRIRLLPVLFNPPKFASSRPRLGARRGTYPPRANDDMGRFAAAVARRYGSKGTLWSERPRLPRTPIRAWQVWNEPNVPVYWASGPNSAQYTALLGTVGTFIKTVDPRAEILAAGLPQSNTGVPFQRYLRGMYRAGAVDAFDTLSIHPYAATARGTVSAVRYARRLMNRYHDRRAGIWVTEFGWASHGPSSAFRVGYKGQAIRVSKAMRGLAKRRRGLRLRGIVYYKLRDNGRLRGQRNFFGWHTGLLTRRGTTKPALRAFARTARRLTR